MRLTPLNPSIFNCKAWGWLISLILILNPPRDGDWGGGRCWSIWNSHPTKKYHFNTGVKLTSKYDITSCDILACWPSWWLDIEDNRHQIPGLRNLWMTTTSYCIIIVSNCCLMHSISYVLALICQLWLESLYGDIIYWNIQRTTHIWIIHFAYTPSLLPSICDDLCLLRIYLDNIVYHNLCIIMLCIIINSYYSIQLRVDP